MRTALARQRGVTMIDAVIALALLSFGLLALTRLQARTLAQGSESSARLTASVLVDELLSNAVIDNTNYACYTLPATGTCGSTQARTSTDGWKTRVEAALPGAAASAVYDGTSQRLKVTVTWTGKESATSRTVEVTTDVR